MPFDDFFIISEDGTLFIGRRVAVQQLSELKLKIKGREQHDIINKSEIKEGEKLPGEA